MKTNTITTKAKRAHFPLQTQAAVSPAKTTATAAERYARTNSNNANPLAQKSNKRANNKTTHCRATPRAQLAVPLVFPHCTYVFVCRLATGNSTQQPRTLVISLPLMHRKHAAGHTQALVLLRSAMHTHMFELLLLCHGR